jgi:hypothetical protein
MEGSNAYGTFHGKPSNDGESVDVGGPLSPVHNVLHHSCSSDDTVLSVHIQKSHGISSAEAEQLLKKYGKSIFFLTLFYSSL